MVPSPVWHRATRALEPAAETERNSLSPGQRWDAREQGHVLDVVELEHQYFQLSQPIDMTLPAREEDRRIDSVDASPCYCIWSSIEDKFAFTLRAFFISSAVTNGYSPYSRKLGH